MHHQLICNDFLDYAKNIQNKSVDLIILDAPYNINKAEWDKISNYVEWMGTVFLECQRVLKDNGSFYFFHNDFLQLVELQQWITKNTEFVFKQLIVWNKINETFKNIGHVQQRLSVEMQRNYYGGYTEYVLYYTFQEETGLTTIKLDTNNFTTLRQYFKDLQEYIGVSKIEIVNEIGQCSDHCFRWKSSQWELPTPETYQELINKFHIDKWKSFREYESLRQEYESLRYTFNTQRVKDELRSNSNVWLYLPAHKQGHLTPKPIALIENIIKHSSNEGDTILDPMCGSGTTLIAANRLNRNSMGIETNKDFCELSYKRLLEEVTQSKLNTDKLQSTIEKTGF